MPGRTRGSIGVRKASISRALSRADKTRRPARIIVGRVLLVGALVLATVQLVKVQAFDGPQLASAAEDQRITPVSIPAKRGTITDAQGTKMAFSVDVVALTARPKAMRGTWDEAQGKLAKSGGKAVSYDQHAADIAGFLKQQLGDQFNEQDVLARLRSDRTFTYLDEKVDPQVATKIREKFPDIGQEKRSMRRYPAGSVAANVVGMASWRKDQKPPGMQGLTGLEHALNTKLAGKDGRREVDTGNGSDVVIPGTERDVRPAVPGMDVKLTLDEDVQYKTQQLLDEYRDKVKARGGSIAVLDVKTGKVVALADDKNYDPNDPSTLNSNNMGDPAISSPFEPGSVGKAITAAGALQEGVVKPDDVVTVPGSVKVADRTVHDDWSHPTQRFSFTGILAKSSNVGILKIANRLGPEKFEQYLKKFGIGQRTGIELAGESPGFLPSRKSWSASTFGNLPFGQGYSMTTLQMASAYQAIANGGVRIPPRIIQSTTGPDGKVVEHKSPKGTRVIGEQAAKQLVGMLRSVTQKAPSPNEGTAPSAALDGYQVAGKTGTAQQVDPKTGKYSQSEQTTTFAGLLPADHPRFVAAIMLDRPTGQGGQTAAPLFHDLGSYLTQRYNVRLSDGPTPKVKFVLN
ncbi:peptidoglycan D,D-transpeptidase FtsI family protein [Sciscionella marina]|uniref:peptidoglycan D,D-transpeptidase FtsI family protein n=1 Tax=Sciscionella marina TaxID=508770 RepID=UPI0003A798F8|nr:penicillin-binding protein 2 [Sciscionella marina]